MIIFQTLLGEKTGRDGKKRFYYLEHKEKLSKAEKKLVNTLREWLKTNKSNYKEDHILSENLRQKRLSLGLKGIERTQYVLDKDKEGREYLVLDGDGIDSINETMIIDGPLSPKKKEELKRIALQMREIDQALAKAERDGRLGDVQALTSQWETKRTLLNIMTKSPRMRTYIARKKDNEKIIETTNKRKGIYHEKSKGMTRERVRFNEDL